MYESERHRIILSAIQEKPVVTVQDIAELTDASEATIRRDIASLHVQGKLRRVRGGESLAGMKKAAFGRLFRYGRRSVRGASMRISRRVRPSRRPRR